MSTETIRYQDMRATTARHAGECSQCMTRIDKGERIAYTRSFIMCDECWQSWQNENAWDEMLGWEY